MKIEQFEEALRKDDFSVGDSFWLDAWEFEVVNTTKREPFTHDKAVAFKWQLKRQDFIQLIRDKHPEVKNPEGFFDEHGDAVLHYFREGFYALFSGHTAVFRSVMNDAIEQAIEGE